MLGIVDGRGHNTSLSNIAYHHDDGSMWAAVGTQVIEVKS